MALSDGNIRLGTAVSAAGHVLLVVVAQFGVHFFHEPPPVTANLVAVDVVNIDDVTRPPKAATPEPDPEPEPPVAAPKPPPAPPQKAPEPPEPPKEVAKAPEPKPEPPKPVEKQPEPKPEPPKEVAKTPEPAPAPPKTPEPKPEPPKQAEKQPEPKPELAEAKPVSKPKAPVQKKPDPKPEKDFNSLLKDLTKRQDSQKAETTDRRPKAPSEKGEKAPQQAQVSDRPSIAELDRMRQIIRDRVQPCWNPPIGARDANDLVVTLNLSVERDGTVRDVRVEDSARMATNQFFKAAADAARRAVLNPRCQPFDLPAERYDVWKDIKFNFDPREMLG